MLEKDKACRIRSFTAENFFRVMIILVSGSNRDGAERALNEVFGFADKLRVPTRAAFCKFRSKISWKWFRDCFSSLFSQTNHLRQRWYGMYIYAIDGKQIQVPRTKDLMAKKFSGKKTSKYQESYMPKAYLTALYDVLSGLCKQITFNPTLHENADAYNILTQVEEGSLVIYDRLYFSEKLVRRHSELGLKFLFRLRSNSNKAIKKFAVSNKQSSTTEIAGKRVKLIKFQHRRSKETLIFATNLPDRHCDPKTLADLYRCRWEIELFFRELTDQTKSHQWHSKTLNGIKQELYTQLWLINCTKANMLLAGQKPCQPQAKVYKKANFKQCYLFVVRYLASSFDKFQYMFRYLQGLINKTTQRRIRFSREYERVIKSPRSTYKYYGSNWYWELNPALS